MLLLVTVIIIIIFAINFCRVVSTPTSYLASPGFNCRSAILTENFHRISQSLQANSGKIWRKCVPGYTAEQPRRQSSLCSSPLEPQISPIIISFFFFTCDSTFLSFGTESYGTKQTDREIKRSRVLGSEYMGSPLCALMAWCWNTEVNSLPSTSVVRQHLTVFLPHTKRPSFDTNIKW
jgi:hypothetical protein